MARYGSLGLVACLIVCTWISDEKLTEREDLDGDGVSWLEDCDDHDSAYSETVLRYRDDDGDGVGDSTRSRSFCRPPDEGAWTELPGDCDDTDSAVFPGAAEVCNGHDDDCDMRVDDDDDSLDTRTATQWFYDIDEDGVPGQPTEETNITCLPPAPDWAEAPTDGRWDCDDRDPNAFPGNPEEAPYDGIRRR